VTADIGHRCAAWINAERSVIDDPYPLWHDMRTMCPVVHEPGHGVWLVSRYADCQAIARDAATWSSVLAAKGPIRGEDNQRADAMREHIRAVGAGEAPTGNVSLLIDAALGEQVDRLQHNDPPSYATHRSLVSRWFTPTRVAALEPRIRDVAGSLIDAFATVGAVEFLTAFAGPLPGTIIADLLDVPRASRPDFIEWDSAIAGNTPMFEATDDEAVARLARTARIQLWLGEAVVRRRGTPGSDLISELVNARLANGEPLPDDHARQMAHTFHVGGQETVSKLLTSSVRLVATDHDLQSTLRAEPQLIPAFIEEALRIQSPTQGLFRVARVDTEVNGNHYPAGAMVQLLFGSANRDTAVFDNPDAIDLERPNLRSHLAFGHGIHLCPGNHLARLEAKVALEELLGRTQSITLSDSNTFEYMTSHVMRGIVKLELDIEKG
jgi:cytochrome P450